MTGLVEPATLLVEEPLVVVVAVSEDGHREQFSASAALGGEVPGDWVEAATVEGFGGLVSSVDGFGGDSVSYVSSAHTL